MKKITCMLVDDDSDDIFFHEQAIEETHLVDTVIVMNTAVDALSYLKSDKNTQHADLIFLDINMPCMNGWEFLEEYNKMDERLRGKAILIMLSSSNNQQDKVKAKSWNFVSDYITKPLTPQIMQVVMNKHFN